MFKIENNLLIKSDKLDLTLLNVLDEFYKEMHMLISNIHLTHVLIKDNIDKVFPLETNLYDGSWYKNLLISANIIFDRLHMVIDENIPYDSIFKEKDNCDFKALANLWNKINFIIKFNLPDSILNERAINWNLVSTSRKLEEIIATNVDINQPLLETISLNLDKYKSIPKTMVEKNEHSYDELVNVLTNNNVASGTPTPPAVGGFNNNASQPLPNSGFGNQNNNLLSPTAPLPTPPVVTSVRESGDKPPINPLKKELDAIVKWVDFKNENVKTYLERKRLGYDPNEYKKICELLPLITKELDEINLHISTAKVNLPINPLKGEMDKLVRWCSLKEKAVQIYKRNQRMNLGGGISNTSTNKVNLKQELAQIIKSLMQISQEVNLIDDRLSYAKSHLPKDPILKEMQQLLRWVSQKEAAVNTYKRNLRKKLTCIDQDSELIRIEKEMSIIDERINQIDNNILKFDNENLTNSLQASYEDELLQINNKLNDVDLGLKDVNASLNKTKNTKLVVQTNPDFSRAKRLYNWIDHKQKELLRLQKRLTNRLNMIKQYDEQILKFHNDLVRIENTVYDNVFHNQNNQAQLKPQLVANFVSNNGDDYVSYPSNDDVKYEVLKEELLEPSSNDFKFDDYKNDDYRTEISLIEKAQSSIDEEKKHIDNQLNDTIIDANEIESLDDEQLINEGNSLIDKYNLEAQILKKAFEILPEELKNSANAQLPQMINLLLDEGYITPKDDADIIKKNK